MEPMTEHVAEDAFHAIEWHDAVLFSVSVDRRHPGEQDHVVLAVELPAGGSCEVHFLDCYGIDAVMNFGIIAPETIRSARCSAEHPGLVSVRQRWKQLSSLQRLRCFEFEMNSTASVIRVFAEGFELRRVRGPDQGSWR